MFKQEATKISANPKLKYLSEGNKELSEQSITINSDVEQGTSLSATLPRLISHQYSLANDLSTSQKEGLKVAYKLQVQDIKLENFKSLNVREIKHDGSVCIKSSDRFIVKVTSNKSSNIIGINSLRTTIKDWKDKNIFLLDKFNFDLCESKVQIDNLKRALQRNAEYCKTMVNILEPDRCEFFFSQVSIISKPRDILAIMLSDIVGGNITLDMLISHPDNLLRCYLNKPKAIKGCGAEVRIQTILYHKKKANKNAFIFDIPESEITLRDIKKLGFKR
ncbi:hypothetical protein ACPV36_15455 [Photobacterium damselae]|uniref:hypothetical protein n=1 Tax=Photobacterium damselae TaxID=38293 RepID=UPI00406893C8